MPIPEKIDSLINYAHSHRETWDQGPLLLGLTQQMVDDLASLVLLAQQRRLAVIAARDASRSATLEQASVLEDLIEQLRLMERFINATAKASADPKSIYALADLPLPKTPTDLPAPVDPTNAKVELNSGKIKLSWTGSLEQGTYFIIRRGVILPGSAPTAYEFIANVQEKTYTDEDVPVGVATVNYEITAYRNKLSSKNSLLVTIPLGAVDNIVQSTATATVQEQPIAEAA